MPLASRPDALAQFAGNKQNKQHLREPGEHAPLWRQPEYKARRQPQAEQQLQALATGTRQVCPGGDGSQQKTRYYRQGKAKNHFMGMPPIG